MKQKKSLADELPMMAMKEIPKSKPDAKIIVALVKKDGQVVGYQFDDGQKVDKEQAIQMARNGDIKDVGIAQREGNEYLKSLPDSKQDNNLGSLPSVEAE